MKKSILCIGAGYVGGPTMAVIASRCPQWNITVADISEARIAAWNSSDLPIYEPGLDEIVQKVRGKNLFFTTDIARGIRENDVIFVSVNTPTKTFGAGAGFAPDLQYWESTARAILEHAGNDKIVVEKSTLPVRTAEAMHRILDNNHKKLHFDVVSNPEFLAEGTAIRDLLDPDRVLIGTMPGPSGNRAGDLIASIYQNWIAPEKIKRTNVWSSELTKLAANALLAQRISSVNSLAALCEETGADIEEVAQAAGMDHRIGKAFLRAGVGFGGSCFRKDILHLVYLAEQCGLPEVATYWRGVVEINDYQQRRFVQRVMNALFHTLAGKRLAIFGFAFKADTGDTRESPAAAIAKMLLEEHAKLAIYDPKAMANARAELASYGDAVEFSNSAAEAARGAHAILILTEWAQFRDFDYAGFYQQMEKPAFLFDGRNLLDHQMLHKIGFTVCPVGRPTLSV
ncbi:MAG: nucleotide sugar dehydrogenase [Victivallaceae bacterium]|nr:nucleotide sugar dehydrogenase [Victivallaceae bacterium]